MSDKYQAAIIEYRAANLAVRAISQKIGGHLADCASAMAAAGLALPEDGKSPHLKEAYSFDRDGSEFGVLWYRVYDDPAEDYLKGACPHCYSVHFLIQERKQARTRFAAAKRRLMAMAKALEVTE